jgi:hypothetical protein
MSHVPYDELPFFRMPNPLPCGCAIVGIQGINLLGTHTESRDSHIRYCPTHAAAPELVKVLRDFVEHYAGPNRGQLGNGFAYKWYDRAEAAIEAAEGEA